MWCKSTKFEWPALLSGQEALSKLPYVLFVQLQVGLPHLQNLGMIQIFLNFRHIFDLMTPSDFTFLLPYSYFNSPNYSRTKSLLGLQGVVLTMTVKISWVHTTWLNYIGSVYWHSHFIFPTALWNRYLNIPFCRWGNWLRDRTCSRTCSWKEQNWGVKLGLNGYKTPSSPPLGFTASSNYAAFILLLRGCKEEMARITVQTAFDTSLSFFTMFFFKKKKRKEK